MEKIRSIPEKKDPLFETRDSRLKIGFLKDNSLWKSARANFNEGSLEILGHSVMMDWETPYMKALAEIAVRNGGVVLELGFGMGISAGFINQAAIKKHIIIEANHEVYLNAIKFANSTPNNVEVTEDLWEKVIDDIPDASIDGILFDTYPLSELEIHKNHYPFFKHAYRILKPEGILTYYSDESGTYSEEHLTKLLETGFKKENIHSVIIDVEPPSDCAYWNKKTFLAPIIVK